MPKLLKGRKDLPEWFPLPIYSRDLSDEQWFEELVLRYGFKVALQKGAPASEIRDGFLSAVIHNNRGENLFFSDTKRPFEVWGVWEISAFELMYLAAAMLTSKKGQGLLKSIQDCRSEGDIERLAAYQDNEFYGFRQDSFGDYIDWDNEPFQISDIVPRFPVTVDIEQDDKTLKQSFEIWLAGARRGDAPAKRQFDERDFRKWKKYGVLPIFDLQFWAHLSESKYTDTLIADSLWRDEDVNTTERLRKIARPLSETLFDSWRDIGRLGRQIELMKMMQGLIKKKKEKADL